MKENAMLDKTPMTPEWENKRNFWKVRNCYVQDRRGDPDADFEAYCCALGDGHMPEEILDAAVAMTLSAIGKNFVYPWIPPLAQFLMNLPPPASNVVPLRPE
jgi:hypothetical protein